jgi:hypothetical protein
LCSQRRPRPPQVRILAALVLALATTVGVAVAADVTPETFCAAAVPFDSKNFTRSTTIDNEFLPLTPGTRFILEGRANRTGQPLAHQVIFTVTDLTMVINGVRSRVMHDVDVNDDVLIEEELSFFAQDDAGRVWNTGEYPEEYLNGVFAGAPRSWFSGLEFAEAGVHMLNNPQLGTPPYLQGDAPLVNFMDCGEVYQKDLTRTVPVKTYERVLAIREWAPRERGGGFQLKYHAPGIGIVEVGAINDPEGETLVLVERRQLNPAELAQVRRASLAVDKHGRATHNLYRQTKPLELASSTPTYELRIPLISRTASVAR